MHERARRRRVLLTLLLLLLSLSACGATRCWCRAHSSPTPPKEPR